MLCHTPPAQNAEPVQTHSQDTHTHSMRLAAVAARRVSFTETRVQHTIELGYMLYVFVCRRYCVALLLLLLLLDTEGWTKQTRGKREYGKNTHAIKLLMADGNGGDVASSATSSSSVDRERHNRTNARIRDPFIPCIVWIYYSRLYIHNRTAACEYICIHFCMMHMCAIMSGAVKINVILCTCFVPVNGTEHNTKKHTSLSLSIQAPDTLFVVVVVVVAAFRACVPKNRKRL